MQRMEEEAISWSRRHRRREAAGWPVQLGGESGRVQSNRHRDQVYRRGEPADVGGHAVHVGSVGQDFWTLLRSGYRPLALVFGTCVYHVAHQTFGQFFKTMGRNTEMPNFTQALYDARELAMERMQHEAVNIGAEGIVGANIHESTHSWNSHVIEFLAVGTAVVSTSDDHHIQTPQLTMSLNADQHHHRSCTRARRRSRQPRADETEADSRPAQTGSPPQS